MAVDGVLCAEQCDVGPQRHLAHAVPKVQGLGFRVWGLGFKDQNVGC